MSLDDRRPVTPSWVQWPVTSDDRAAPVRSDFIRDVIEDDLRTGAHGGRVVTRFPPEPNGYLHIGHAKSICLNFGVAQQYGGHTNLRFDDTNPAMEDVEYVDSIERDVAWLGFSFKGKARYASDYFEEMYELAEVLIRKGEAYVDDLDDEQIKEYRGSLMVPGVASSYRARSVEENLTRFRQMRSGDLADGTCVLRARIDLGAANMKMRDPLLYRIRHVRHHRTGDAWPIYPMYDFAHPISDAIEGVTHSICTLEFESNRELYDWVIAHTGASERHNFSRPQQLEFARLNLDYTVMSKRKLKVLVEDGHVASWDDPRLPTIAGMRRRGYPPEAIRAFADMIGVAKVNSTVDLAKLEFCVRDDLNWTAPRVMGVLDPLRLTVTSWPLGEVEQLTGPYFPPDIGKPGSRLMPFSRDILIEREDFTADPPSGYQRLAPGRTVRLRHGYCITCDEVIEEGGEVVEVRGRHIPDTVGKAPPGVKVWGVIHWVSAPQAVPGEVRLYDRLFAVARPEDSDGSLSDTLNPDSLRVVPGAMLEPSLATAEPGSRWQLERLGYFVFDREDSQPGNLVLNRIVTLRDSWQGGEKGAPQSLTPSVPGKVRSAKSTTRPPKKSRPDYRIEARLRDPILADRFASWPARYGISEAYGDLLTGDRATGDLFTGAVAAGAAPMAVARWIINEVPHMHDNRDPADIPLTGSALGRLIVATESGEVSGPAAKEVLAELVLRGGNPEEIIATNGLAQVSDESEVSTIVDQVLAGNADKVDQYRGGKTALLGFFVGQVVRVSKGKANPQVIRTVLLQRLG